MDREDILAALPATAADREVLVALIDEFAARRGDVAGVLPDVIAAYRMIVEAFSRKAILFMAGNGGSFSDAVHIKGEIAKSFERARELRDEKLIGRLRALPMGPELIETLELGYPVVVLGESHSLRSAFENDRDPVFSYAQELNSFLHGLGDGVMLGISTSGTARNVLAAMSLGKGYGIGTISFTGPGGGPMSEIADVAIKVPGASTALIQEGQFPTYHLLCKLIEAHFFPEMRK
jgi:D-sedoheptulose 7-phosphate isomerase